MDEYRQGWRRGARSGLLVGLGLGVVVAAVGLRRDIAALANHARGYVRSQVRVERPVLIVNRWSGDGKAEKLGLADAARKAGVEVVMLERGNDLVELAEAAVARGADALGMAGGDGSLGLVASVAINHGLPFFCIPVGTRNHFALDLGLDRDKPLSALAALSNGEEIAIDHGLVGGRVFLNNVSLGVYPMAVKKENYRAQKVKSLLDTVGDSAVSTDAAPDVHFEMPDGRRFDSSPLVMISNNKYTFAGPPDFGRRRRLDAGVLGIGAVAAPSTSASDTIDLKGRNFIDWTATHYSVEAQSGVVEAGVDGESIDFPSPLQFEIRPKALRVLVPRGTRPGYLSTEEVITAKLLDLVQLGGDPEPN